MSANQLKSDTVKFCFHCGYLNDSKRDVCLYCGYELPNVIHTKNEQKQLEKTFNNYVLNDLGMNKFLSDFNSHLKNLNFIQLTLLFNDFFRLFICSFLLFIDLKKISQKFRIKKFSIY